MLMLDEDESFSLSAYIEAPGQVRVAPSGYLVSHRSDGTYIAPLIPQLFYGWNGAQLQTWRQDITATGEQVILSRVGGEPSVPREELYWRKVKEAPKPAQLQPTVTCPQCGSSNIEVLPGGYRCLDCGYVWGPPPPNYWGIIILGGIFLLLVLGKR
jgi:hypothetical protein